MYYKDELLNILAETKNVAQFLSFAPDLTLRFSQVKDFTNPETLEEKLQQLLNNASDGTINVRSFKPHDPKSKPFHYGISTATEAAKDVRQFAADGLYTIVNETIDINDGGVSGVLLGNIIEFAPKDTPRCVEKEGVCSLPRDLGKRVLAKIYETELEDLQDVPLNLRLEFSVHTKPRGIRGLKTLVWEQELVTGWEHIKTNIIWPNRFSQHTGDKPFGLILASAAGFLVPRTLVIPRNLPPFTFGIDTGNEKWVRTAPNKPVAGFYTTTKGYSDPFEIVSKEDQNKELSSVLVQDGIVAKYSGACLLGADGDLIIECVKGYGDGFMVGTTAPVHGSELEEINAKIRIEYERLSHIFGAVRFEWVADMDDRIWILQLHRGATTSFGNTIFSGNPEKWIVYPVSNGLEGLRTLIGTIKDSTGIVLKGSVGISSHFGDVLRKAEIPSIVENI